MSEVQHLQTTANPRRNSMLWWGLCLSLTFSLAQPVFLVPVAGANPGGESVVSGKASFSRGDNHLQVDVSDGGIIKWDQFDIGADESVRFVQPGEWARVLNQVREPGATHIDGSLTANGQVYIVNPNGVFFGGNAVVDVGRLVTAAGTISDEEFRAGVDHFTDLAGTVENAGVISADAVALLGRSVANHGRIEVGDGSLILAAGDEIWITERDSPVLIRLRSSGDGGDRPAVENTGVIEAGRGQVRLAAGDWLSYAIRSSGEIRAKNIALEGGENGAVIVDGRLDASDTSADGVGGSIQVLGDRIALLAGSELDASGTAGGGSVRVGGDLQGEGSLRTASVTSTSAGSRIDASAHERGDGGDVVVWADEIAEVHGEIAARGGDEGGEGGFVETSGKQFLALTRAPDLSAPNGDGGKWLIDPTNVDIIAPTDPPREDSLDPAIESESFLRTGVLFPNGTEYNTLTTDVLEGALSNGVDVTVTTRQFANLGKADGDIRMLAPITFDDGDEIPQGTTAELTLRAANNITLYGEGDTVEFDGEMITLTEDASILNDAENLELSVTLLANDDNRLVLTGDGVTTVLSQPANPVGPGQTPNNEIGDVVIHSRIRTGGGVVDVRGVNVTVGDGSIEAGDPPRIDSGGGAIALLAGELSEDDFGFLHVVTNGGDLEVASGSRIESGGADITLRATPSIPENGEERGAHGNALIQSTMDSSSADGTGGNIFFTVSNDLDIEAGVQSGGGSVFIDTLLLSFPIVTLTAPIETGGGGLSLRGDSLTMGADARIDAADDPMNPVDGGLIDIQTDGEILIDDRGAEPLALRGEELRVSAGVNGVGDLVVGTDAEIAGNVIALMAGDGYTPEVGAADPTNPTQEEQTNIDQAAAQRESVVSIGTGSVVRNLDSSGNPNEVAILQDADRAALDLAFFADANLSGLDYTLGAADGSVSIDSPDDLAGTALTLIAADSVAVGTSTAPPISLERLKIRIAEDFTISRELADTFGAPLIEISAGDPFSLNDVGTVSGSLTVDDHVTLRAQISNDPDVGPPSIQLHSGVSGEGDLVIGEQVRFIADDVGLWAGDASSDGDTPLPEVQGIENATFWRRTSDGPFSFSLRQNDHIDGADVPEPTQFVDRNGTILSSLSGLFFSLQSDSGSVTIDDPAKVADTDLSLIGVTGPPDDPTGDPIVLPDAGIAPASVQLGGVGNFRVTNNLLTGVRSDDITLRAGVNVDGVLDFEANVQVNADRIRLFAGDGSGPRATSSIDIAGPGGPDEAPVFANSAGTAAPEFLTLRQDLGFTDSQLPVADQFLSPLPLLGVRSDGQTISIADLEAALVTLADDGELLLAARSVSVSNTDGANLDFDAIDQLVRLRSNSVILSATDPEELQDAPPTVDASSNLELYGFEVSVDEFDPTPAADPATSPDAFAIQQDGDIVPAALPRASAFGDGLDNANSDNRIPVVYTLRSNLGSILLNQDTTDYAEVEKSSLVLSLIPVTGTPTPDEPNPRGIDFIDGVELRVNRLSLESPDALAVSKGSTVRADTQIVAFVGAAGDGDLSFLQDVVWTAPTIAMRAGAGGDRDTAVVDARSNSPRFVLEGADPDTSTSFSIFQDGSVTAFAPDTAPEDSTLPAFTEAELATIDNYLIQSAGADVTIEDFDDVRAASVRIAAATELLLGREDGGTKDLDLTGGDYTLLSDDIQLRASGAFSVLAENDGLSLRGSGDVGTSPLLFTIDQDAPILTSNLPLALQFGAGVEPVLYELRSTNSTSAVEVDSDLIDKVLGAQLVISSDTRVRIDDLTDPDEEEELLQLSSLTIRRATVGDDPIDIDIAVDRIATVRDQVYDGRVTLENDITFEGRNVTFLQSLDGPSEVSFEVTGRTTFGGKVGSNTPLDSLRIDNGELGEIQFGILNDDTPVSVDVVGDILLNPDGKEFVPKIATIFKYDGDLSLRSQQGMLQMGRNEKVSVAGALSIEAAAADAPVILGDVSAMSLVVEADRIEIVRRPGGEVLTSTGGTRNEAGVTIVADSIDFHARDGSPLAPIPVDSGAQPVFGLLDGRDAPGFLAGFSTASNTPSRSPLDRNAFGFDVLVGNTFVIRTAVNPTPIGASAADLDQALWDRIDATPRVPPVVEIEYASVEDLAQLGIVARSPTRAEYQTRLSGAGILDDTNPWRRGNDGLVEVVDLRIVADDTAEAVTLHHDVFGDDEAHAAELREVLQGALDEYRNTTGAQRVIGFEFRRYVRNRPNTQFEAFKALERLDALVRRHRRLGLAPSEYRPIQLEWLEIIRPEGITIDEFAEFVRPSRYVRGSDVLDVFGQ